MHSKYESAFSFSDHLHLRSNQNCDVSRQNTNPYQLIATPVRTMRLLLHRDVHQTKWTLGACRSIIASSISDITDVTNTALTINSRAATLTELSTKITRILYTNLNLPAPITSQILTHHNASL